MTPFLPYSAFGTGLHLRNAGETVNSSQFDLSRPIGTGTLKGSRGRDKHGLAAISPAAVIATLGNLKKWIAQTGG